jgi:uroporphyrin-III C-methyltransferase
MKPGKVLLVGAGPGDPGLLTIKALRAIETADAVVYDRLISDAVIKLIPAGTPRVCVGKKAGCHPVPQAEICRMLVSLAKKNRQVVRLKGGDPYIFARGCEEATALERAGIGYEVIPGITAAQGCAASARIPLTHRGLASGVHYVTGHCRDDEPLDLDWASLADPDTTLVVYMGMANIDQIVRQLIAHGLPGDTPALAVCQGTTDSEQKLCAPLLRLPMMTQAAGFDGPVVFIIGRVAGLAPHQSRDDNAVVEHDIAVVA